MEEHDSETAPRKRAVIYIRVSTKQQAVRDGNPEGYSLPTQREACHRKVEALGAYIVEDGEYIDKDTGTSVDKRPAMQELLARIERQKDIDYVIVFKLDRWARKTREDLVSDFVLETAHCALVSCSENIDRSAAGRLLHSMLASVNEYQSNNMSDDIKRKTLAKVQGGGTHGRGGTSAADPLGIRGIRIGRLDDETARRGTEPTGPTESSRQEAAGTTDPAEQPAPHADEPVLQGGRHLPRS
jgi:DNA invertase Pin-like site-specific DNA recombinase